ncbi:MAG: transposase [Flavobacteriales bacterium]|nr:transposase [Flavobacteriales bacterium]
MEHWIGIDVSSATLDFALLDGKGTHLESVQIENDRKAVMKLMGQWSKRHGVEVGKSLICLEATGHYTLMMLNLIVGQQWHAWLAHPNDIQQSMGIKRVKNDKVDALRIAQYACLDPCRDQDRSTDRTAVRSVAHHTRRWPAARRIPGGLHRWLCTLQHAAPALVPCRCRTLRAQLRQQRAWPHPSVASS